MTYYFQDKEKYIYTFNVIIDMMKNYVQIRSGLKIGSSQSELGFKTQIQQKVIFGYENQGIFFEIFFP